MKEWIIKLGPIERTNHAEKEKTAEDGALLKIKDAVKEIMEKAESLVPLLQEGVVAPGGFCEPVVKEDEPELSVISYELPDGKWFSVASSGTFGYRLEFKKE